MIRQVAAPLAVLAHLAAAAGPAGAQEVPGEAEPRAIVEPWQESDRVHEVRRGDTLWDLADRFLSDPFGWRTIFELNPAVVEDPHWIYPGERLRIPGGDVARVDRVRVERAEDLLRNFDEERGRYPANSVFRQPRDDDPGLSALLLDERAAHAVVTRDDFMRAPLLAHAGELGAEGATVRVMEENPLGLDLPPAARRHVEVVLGLGGLTPVAGDTLKAVRRMRPEPPYGDVVVPMALLEVNRLWGDSARATVVQVYGDYRVGDPVVEPEPYELDPAARPEPVEDAIDIDGRVIAFEVEQVLLGPGEVVFLDAGGDAGVRVGDEFAVHSREERDAIEIGADDALAVLRVVHVTRETATARVASVRDAGTRPGDPVRLIRRLSTPAASDTGQDG